MLCPKHTAGAPGINCREDGLSTLFYSTSRMVIPGANWQGLSLKSQVVLTFSTKPSINFGARHCERILKIYIYIVSHLMIDRIGIEMSFKFWFHYIYLESNVGFCSQDSNDDLDSDHFYHHFASMHPPR